ncbi:HIT family protein [Streptomyces albidoflavus]|uniref:HIT family protein n=1 Tax=Streptomyces albidoflavus TaxID=1886 RepID=UPI002F920CE3
MTADTGPGTLYRQLADVQRESDRLRVAVAARMTFEDVVARHNEIGWQEDVDPHKADAIRQEAAEYLSGRRPVPLPVSSAELIAHARRRIEVLGRLAEAGIEEAVEGIAEAEAELAEELRKVEAAGCVFCSIAAGIAPATVLRDWGDVLAIRPRGGVNKGHALVIPRYHVEDAGVDKRVSGRVMECASELMAEEPSANIITSKGEPATQTVYHLHLHLVPRAVEDGYPLPWTPQQTPARQAEGER